MKSLNSPLRLSFSLIFLGFIFSVGIISCGTNSSGNDSVPFEIVEEGSFSGITNQQVIVISNESDLNALWDDHSSTLSPIPTKPVLDFDAEIAIGVFIGGSPVGSCPDRVEITKVERQTIGIRVSVSIQYNPLSVCVQAVQPFEIIKLAKIGNYISFDIDVSESDL